MTEHSSDDLPGLSTQDDLIVVGLGASAGGIRALREFFAATPADSGMSYVVILHLSPEHESHLDSVLQHVTSLPVTQVTQPTPVEPNRVYVIPPNKSLAMNDGHLVVSEPKRAEERRSPVDVFFRALAEARQSNAVCVILSGTGPNGSSGLRRVKELGGVVLVQEPREAEYDGMPQHAIATGLVDFILPVEAMPQRIVSYRDSRRRITVPIVVQHADEAQALRFILTQVRIRTGHDFSNYKRATVLRRIERRLSLHQLPDLAAYSRYITENPEEATALLRDLLISVTSFFRDAHTFEALEQRVIPSLFEGKDADQSVRAWVAGCATGEEAYSVAMLLSEHASALMSPPSVLVFATDLDERAIAHAREAYFTDSEVADLSAERLRRFFTKDGDGYRVRRELRERLLFAHHNIIRDPPFSHLDLISCRNLLIYLDRAAQHRVMEVMHFALNPGGALFLGTSESVDGASDLFLTIDKDAHLYQSRSVATRLAMPVPDVSLATTWQPARRHEEGTRDLRNDERLSYADLHHRLVEQYAPPSLVVNEEHQVVHLSERAGRYLHLEGGDMSTDLLRMVRPELRMDVRTALYQAAQKRTSIEVRNLGVQIGDQVERVNVLVRPVLRETDPARGYFVVIFQDGGPGPVEPPQEAHLVAEAEPASRQLEEELLGLRGRLRATVEQYETQAEESKAANEELQAMNEELRSAAEELETSKEELQSVNEELTTVNQELKNKIEELSHANNDFQNLINSTDIGTIFLDRNLRVKLFTPRARDAFNLISADIGRPLSDITSKLVYDQLVADTERVLESLQMVEREVETRSGRFCLLRLLPYRTTEDRIDGVVVTLIDTTERRRAEARIRASEERMRLLVEGAEDYAILTLTPDNRIDSWSVGAERMFGYTEAEIVGQSGAVLFTPEDRTARVPEQELDRARIDGRSEDERWHLRKDGTRIYCSGVMRPFKDAALVGFAKITRDLTSRMRAEAQLRSAHDDLDTRVRERTATLEQEVSDRRAAEERTRQLLRHVVTAQEDERRRVALDLHDQLGQQLTALRLGVERLLARSGQADSGEDLESVGDELKAIHGMAEQLDRDVGFLAWELRPTALDDLGLSAALEQYLTEWSRHYDIEAAWHGDSLRLEQDVEVTLYRMVQEALNNVAKHANATSVEVLLESRPGEIVLIVEDNGVGFNTDESSARGLGLAGMGERAALVRGLMEIESNAGSGTTVYVRIPMAERSDA